ncbi:glycosyltransferase family 1 protein [Mesobacillus harenae]|uniref:glycosyltransferase family 1 protein n=1 Tax=Mesobacillus harenae TaxID=2213203 RepID=UPI001580800A|nr:glycosyltransferase family 1 protein [Mesobacillus harenae]
MKPLRILHVLASLDRGGAEAMIMNIYRKIDRNKIQFDFVVNDRDESYSYEAEIKSLGGRIYRVPRYKITNYYFYKREWEKLISQHPEWKIIHGHHTSPAFIYLSIAKSLNRLTIGHSHIAGGEHTLKSYIKFLMRYPLRYIADYLFACSESAAKWMYGKRSNESQVLNNAIDAKKYVFSEQIRTLKRKELKIEDKFVIGHIGRFQTQKNHLFLIDIFNAVHDKYNNSILLLVGDGELRPFIEKRIKELGLIDSVIFTGVRSDIPDLLQAMDLFLFPSLYEGLGIVSIEAQAAGLHTIVSDTIPQDAYLTNLIESISLQDSKEKWAEKILKYTTGYNRKNTYEQIKSKGYDIEATSMWIQRFYLEHWKE